MSTRGNLDIALDYLASIGSGDPDAATAFFAPDVVQVEFPNRLVPAGATRDLDALREAARRGRMVVDSQRFEVRNALASGDQVALEARWTATLNVALGPLAPGDTMSATFAIFLTFRDGRIVRQHNYDCFDAW